MPVLVSTADNSIIACAEQRASSPSHIELITESVQSSGPSVNELKSSGIHPRTHLMSIIAEISVLTRHANRPERRKFERITFPLKSFPLFKSPDAEPAVCNTFFWLCFLCTSSCVISADLRAAVNSYTGCFGLLRVS